MKLPATPSGVLPLAIFCTALAAGAAHAEMRAFTDNTGRTLRGELTSVSGDSVTIRRENDGQSFTTKAGLYCPADIAYFKAHGLSLEPVTGATTPSAPAAANVPMRIDVSVYPKKTERNRNNSFYEKLQKTNYKIEIKNSESKRDLEKAHGILLSFGKVLKTSDESQLIGKEEFDAKGIRALGQFVFESQQAVRTAYDSYDVGYGVRYSGYLLVLQDGGGKVLNISASSETLGKHSDALLKLNLWDQFDKSFKKTKVGSQPLVD